MIGKTVLTTALTLLVCSPARLHAASAGDMETALRRLDAYVRDGMQKTNIPGLAVAVVYQGRVALLQGYGVRKLGSAATVDADTVFEIASLSKPIAATVVASLVGEGGLSWDDRIQALDPHFALSDPTATAQVTIRDLFSHRSGLPTGAGDVLEDLGYSRPEILDRIRFVTLAGPFRASYHYSNFGLTEAAIAATLKTGKTWEELSESQLYRKIGMRSTSARYSDYENNPNKAALHYLKDGIYKNWFVREADSESPAGGVSSNVRDMAAFMQLQLGDGVFDGRKVVDKAALNETHKPQMCKDAIAPVAPAQCKDGYYGLGWNVGRDENGQLTLSHSGAFDLGSGTAMYLSPSRQVGIAVFTNGTPVGLAEAISLSFLDFFRYGNAQQDYLARFKPLFDEIVQKTQDSSPDYAKLSAPAKPLPGRALAAYAGSYLSTYYGTLRIEVEEDRLVLRLPPRDAYYELTHWDADTFTYHFASENTGVARRGVKFLSGGKQVLIENLAIENDGVFTRIN